jgi:hypothetical protein
MKLIDKNELLEELKKLKQNLSASPIVVIEDVKSLVESLEVKEIETPVIPISQQDEYELVTEQPKEATCTHEVETGNRNIKALVIEKVQQPKFKVGDWVVHDISKDIFLIKSFNNGYCTLEDVKGEIYTPCLSPNDDFHLWTIKDAKDGDVLTWDDSKCITLFKNIYDKESFNSHGFVGHCTGAFESRLSYHDIKGVHPATKEQRDLLFLKMKEAGYEWNTEKKELKKIHVIDEGKAEMDYCFTKMMNGEKVTPAWSEEDEKYIKDLFDYFTGGLSLKHAEEDIVDWLKSLKQRIKKQQ